MKCSILKIESIEENPETVKALLSFAYAAGEPTTLTSCLNRIMTDKQLTPPQVYHRAELDGKPTIASFSFQVPNVLQSVRFCKSALDFWLQKERRRICSQHVGMLSLLR